MVVWRLVRSRRVGEAFTGEGARLFGGRWNSRGVRVVYTSGSLALAHLEYLVRVSPFQLPTDVIAISATLPHGVGIEEVREGQLPKGWRRYDAPPDSLHQIGDRWIRRGATLALRVPSAVVPTEHNLLLNPAHGDFQRVRFGKPERVEFDGRIFGRHI